MQQKSKDFNAFWKTLFSFIITKLASFVCWKWWRRRKGEKKSAGFEFNGRDENGFWRREVHHLPSVVSFKDNFMWNFEIEFSDCDDLWREDRLDHFIRTQNLIRTQSTTPTASIESTVQNFGYIINWQVIWFVSIMKIFSNFPTQRRKTWKTAFRSITTSSCVSLLESVVQENVFYANEKQVSSDREGISTLGKKVISSGRLYNE